LATAIDAALILTWSANFAFRSLLIPTMALHAAALRKERQDPALKLDYRNVFDPD
jgi:hypothetical protein